MTGAVLIPAFAVNADTKIAINEKNFPDKKFRKELKDWQDSDKDGYLSSAEIKKITFLSPDDLGIKDLTGIEFLTYVEELYCGWNELTTIDLSKNTKLKTLCFENNKIVKLDLSNNTELEYLRCEENLLKTLDLSKNTKLRYLFVENNKLDKLDLSKNTELYELSCEGNLLETLDLSKNTELEKLQVNKNKLKTLVLPNTTELKKLQVENNELKTLDLSKNTKLENLNIEDNKIDKLDLSKNTELSVLDCSGNLLKTLDISKNTKLRELYIRNNKLENLDPSKNTELIILSCSGNLLKTLDLSKNTKLRYLFVENNKLDKLDLSSAHALLDLDCSNNAITSLDLGTCMFLRTLICNNNKLTSLDLSANSALDELYCQGNQIDKLDVSGCKCLVKALAGKKEQKNGYVVYANDFGWIIAFDDKTTVVSAQITIDDKTKSMFLDIGDVVSLGFEGADDQTQVKLSSSDKSVVKIGEYNSLITLKAGSSNITAKVGDKEYKFKVTVYYEDVNDNTKFWFEPTYALTEKGVVKGYYNQTYFMPANKCTRAQMVTFIWRLMGSPEPKNKDCSFPDVKKGDYFYKACIWGNENHIVEGYKDGTFGPQIVCARRHAVTFLWRLAGKPEPTGDKTKFIDVFKDIDEDDYFFKATIWATEQKIVAGYSDNTFRPNNDCLRRQMVTFLYKFDKYVGVKK